MYHKEGNHNRNGWPLLLGIGLLLLGFWVISGCQEAPAPTPKPRAYPKVVFPEDGTYQTFDKGYCDFTFEYPTFAQIIQDTNFFGERPVDPCWFDVYVPELNSRIHCSYLPVRDDAHFAKLHNDAFTLAYKHTIRANSIEEIPIRNPYGVGGYTFLLEGPVASSYMFYVSDSTDHYLRGSLYFDTQARPDSLRPVFEFMKKEVDHMLQTFRWEE